MNGGDKGGRKDLLDETALLSTHTYYPWQHRYAPYLPSLSPDSVECQSWNQK